MMYITLDTCVWLNIIRTSLHDDNNEFEEICYWIEKGHLTHITPENLIREWDRNKSDKLTEIVNNFKALNNNILEPHRNNELLKSFYTPDSAELTVKERIQKIDHILKNLSEIAKETPEVISESSRRNLNCLAPNHTQDSFRDTVNILSLASYLKDKKYTACLFSTNNYRDFCISKTNKELHPDLERIFEEASLRFSFFDINSKGGKLFAVHLRPVLPSFEDFLLSKRAREEEAKLAEKRYIQPETGDSTDKDFLENIKHINSVIASKTPTSFEKRMLLELISSHESYKTYFFKNVGKDGLV